MRLKSKNRSFLKGSKHIRMLRFDMYDPPRSGIRELGVNSFHLPLLKNKTKLKLNSQTKENKYL